MEENKENNKLILITVTSLITFILTAILITGVLILGKNILNSDFSGSGKNPDLVKKFEDVKRLIQTEYYEDTDEKKMWEGAISGMADSLKDPYTVYYTSEQMKDFKEKSEGSYVGIGVSVRSDEDGVLTVIETFEGSPAGSVGVKGGDKIIKVDGEDVTQLKDEDLIINKIKGVENTKVDVTVFRPSEQKPIDFSIIREKIKIINIKNNILDNGIGYINIKMFDNGIDKYFEEDLDRLIKSGIKGLIIDVRDNPGGSYSQVVKIADRLIPKGLIVYTQDKKNDRVNEYSDDIQLNLPMVVLINGNSASASEVLAGALKDNNKATLIGTKSFGKGLVQTVYTLEDMSGIKITTARYFTPSGVCIHNEGLEPDEKVELAKEFENYPVSQIPREKDVQLDKAIEVINEKVGR